MSITRTEESITLHDALVPIYECIHCDSQEHPTPRKIVHHNDTGYLVTSYDPPNEGCLFEVRGMRLYICDECYERRTGSSPEEEVREVDDSPIESPSQEAEQTGETLFGVELQEAKEILLSGAEMAEAIQNRSE